MQCSTLEPKILPDCDFTFFSCAISASVSPSCSKIGSQPWSLISASLRSNDHFYEAYRRSVPPEQGRSCPRESQHRPQRRKFCYQITWSLPWKINGSILGPEENAKVQTASAFLLEYGSSILFNPSLPSDSKKYLLEAQSSVESHRETHWHTYMYGPGSRFIAINSNAESSTITGPLICQGS